MLSEQLQPENSISFDSFIKYARDNIVPENQESVWGLRHKLAQLALNLDWLYERMIGTTITRDKHELNGVQPSYFILHECKKFTLRANLWLPEKTENAQATLLENAAYSYDYPHNHNFDILSITCLGEGYKTHVYNHIDGNAYADIGETIKVKYLGKIQQPLFMALYYERLLDIHTQLPPEDVFVTLNVLPTLKKNNHLPQLIFENISRTKLKVLNRPLSPEGRELSALRMIGKLAALEKTSEKRLKKAISNIGKAHKNKLVARSANHVSKLIEGESGSNFQNWLLSEIKKNRANLKYYQVAELANRWR